VARPGLVFLVLAAVCAIAFAAFEPSLRNGFTNWDDPGYVTETALIRDLSYPGLKAMATTFVEGNYHPLTMLSLAIDYHRFQLDARGYHLTNVVLHTLNTGLALWFALLLSGSLPIAAVAALFFGIHPLHVESVAWISERKDVLYAMFYLGACIAYLFFVRRGRFAGAYYGGALVLFLLSLLSKGMAVTLPVALLLIDAYRGRPLTLRSVIEKAPFLLLSLLFGVIAVVAQREKGAIQPVALYPFQHRLLFAAYGAVAYLGKALIPLKLSAFYPYPASGAGSLPVIFYVSPLISALIAFGAYLARKRAPLVTFAAAFYLLTVTLVLQLLPVGSALIADRYTYLPYLGVGLALGYAFVRLLGRSPTRRALVALLFVGFGAALLGAARARCATWKDNTSLWTDVIRKYPRVTVAYNNLGLTYKQHGDLGRAMAQLEKVLAIDPYDADALCNRGNCLFLTGQHDSALVSLDRALTRRPRFPVGYNSRGAIYFSRGDYQRAVNDFDRAVALKRDYPEAYLNRANALSVLGRYAQALPDYDVYLKFDPRNGRAHYWRGLANAATGSREAAVADYGRAIEVDPRLGDAHLARSRVLDALGRPDQAWRDAMDARALGVQVDDAYLGRLEAITRRGR
jgi:tetratricopeptide (TPR) repeat protein